MTVGELQQGSPAATPHVHRAPRRVLLVTGSLGGGHHAAARAAEEQVRAAWPGVDVRWTETLAAMGPAAGKLFPAVYAGCVRRMPWLYGFYYWLLGHVRPFAVVTAAVVGTWCAPGLRRAVNRYDPDLVVAAFPEAVQGLGRLRRRGHLPMTAVALVADPAPSPLWLHPALDLHLVSTDVGAELASVIAPTARVRVGAWPVVTAFHPPPHPPSTPHSRPESGLQSGQSGPPPARPPAPPPGPGSGPLSRQSGPPPWPPAGPWEKTPSGRRPLVYVSGGALTFGDLAAACAAVLAGGGDVLVGCGREPDLRRRLLRLADAHPGRMEVRDWIDDPAATLPGCDAVVTNAGGATALEALACARPLLLFAPIPGHGRANARVLARAGLARICPTAADLTTAVAAPLRPPPALCRSAAADLAAVAALSAPRPGSRVRPHDALFLHVAGPPQHIGACVVLDDPLRRVDWRELVVDRVTARAPALDLLCRRLAPGRRGRALRWRHDPAPDPARHVRADVLRSDDLDAAVTAFFAAPLDLTVAAWELQIVRDGPRTALLVKAHHALGDGIAVTEALVRLLADDAVRPPTATPLTATPPTAMPPTTAPLTTAPLTAAAPNATAPTGATRELARAGAAVRGIVSLARAGLAPPSPLSRGGGRPCWVSARLDGRRVRAAARAHGVGTTAVVLAAAAEALHHLVQRPPTYAGSPPTPATTRGVAALTKTPDMSVRRRLAGRRPDHVITPATSAATAPAAPGPLRVMVPVTTRTRADVRSHATGNRTAALAIDLPLAPMTAAERVRRVAAELDSAARARRAEGSSAVLAGLGLLPHALQAPLAELVYGPRFFHAIASVLPGVRRPLYVGGAPVTAVYPVLPLADGVGLAFGALHWGTGTTVGITCTSAAIADALPNALVRALTAISDSVDTADRPRRLRSPGR